MPLKAGHTFAHTLDDSQCVDLYLAYRDTAKYMSDIAAEFGVSESTGFNIIRAIEDLARERGYSFTSASDIRRARRGLYRTKLSKLLTNSECCAIYLWYRDSDRTLRDIAADYGVSHQVAYFIIERVEDEARARGYKFTPVAEIRAKRRKRKPVCDDDEQPIDIPACPLPAWVMRRIDTI